MKQLIVFILVLLVIIGAVGFWRGWFSVNREGGEIKGHVDAEKFKKDKLAFTKTASAKAKEMKDQIAELLKRAGKMLGDEKTSTEKELHELEAKHDKLENQLKELEEAGEDKFGDIKADLEKKLDEVEKKMHDLTKKLEQANDKLKVR